MKASERKWNNSSSFDITRMSLEELQEAIPEWACGNRWLEKVLWDAYHTGYLTTYSGQSTIGFVIDEHSIPKLKQLCRYAQDTPGITIEYFPYGNPYSGPNWWKPSFMVWYDFPANVDHFWWNIDYELTHDSALKSMGAFSHIFDFKEFLDGKVTGIRPRMKLSEHGFTLILRCDGNREMVREVFNIVLSSRLLAEHLQIEHRRSSIDLEFYSDDVDSFEELRTELVDNLKSMWSLPMPDADDDEVDDWEKSMVMHYQYGASPEGIEKMNDWLNANRGDSFREVHY